MSPWSDIAKIDSTFLTDKTSLMHCIAGKDEFRKYLWVRVPFSAKHSRFASKMSDVFDHLQSKCRFGRLRAIWTNSELDSLQWKRLLSEQNQKSAGWLGVVDLFGMKSSILPDYLYVIIKGQFFSFSGGQQK